ncbi:thiol-disulfide oxidoreductase ResA [Brevibacillus fluminis]|uniref:thiol-disulfide oxidoreductase ResA n=1 Tax=Brevibacillus fluminis TaxID=511487 RepID=UPI003F899048
MMDKRKRLWMRVAILGVLLGALVFAVYSSFAKDNKEIKIGMQAPNFSLEQLNANGKELKLSDLKGKGVVLNFWGSWCEPCKAEFPELEKQYQRYKADGIVIVGVNISETPLAIQQFVDQYRVSFPILMDRQSEITRIYQIGPIPTTFFINKDGIVQDQFIGQMSESTIIQKINKIKP